MEASVGAKPRLPVDRGWAWWVVVGYFINLYIAISWLRSLAILLPVFLDKYQQSTALTTLAFGIGELVEGAAHVLLSLILINRVSVRYLVLFGTIANVLAILSLSLWSNIVLLNAAFGVIGIARAFLLNPQIYLLGTYFKKRLSFASSIGNTGTSLATISTPLLTQLLLVSYGLEGTFLMFAAIATHSFVSSLLFRPTTMYDVNAATEDLEYDAVSNTDDDDDKKDRVNILSSSFLSLRSQSSLYLFSDKMVTAEEPFGVCSKANEQANSSHSTPQPIIISSEDNERGFNGNALFQMQTALSNENSSRLGNNDVYKHNALQYGASSDQRFTTRENCTPNTNASDDISSKIPQMNGDAESITVTDSDENEQCENSSNKNKSHRYHDNSSNTDHSQHEHCALLTHINYEELDNIQNINCDFDPEGLDNIQNKNSDFDREELDTIENKNLDIDTEILDNNIDHDNIDLNNEELGLDNTKTDSRISNSERGRVKNRHKTDVKRGPNAWPDTKKGSDNAGRSPSPPADQDRETLTALDVMRNPTAVLITLAGIFGTQTQCGAIYLPVVGLEQGLTRDQLPWILTIGGVSDILGKIMFGYISDRRWFQPINIACLCLFNAGFVFQFVSYFQGLASMISLTVLFGLHAGIIQALQAPISVEYAGLPSLPHIISGVFLGNCLLTFLAHLVVGTLRDVTGSFRWGVRFIGALQLIAVMLLVTTRWWAGRKSHT